MFTPAVLITGGFGAKKLAEIYHPERNSYCKLVDLPENRRHHTQDGDLLCGGWGKYMYSGRSCRRWNPDTGGWDLVTDSLIEERAEHISWTPVDGTVTYLMGGHDSPSASDVIDNHNNIARASFPINKTR